MHKRFGGPIAIILELSKGPIVSALQKYDLFLDFRLIPVICYLCFYHGVCVVFIFRVGEA